MKVKMFVKRLSEDATLALACISLGLGSCGQYFDLLDFITSDFGRNGVEFSEVTLDHREDEKAVHSF